MLKNSGTIQLTDPNVQFPIEECNEDGVDDVIRLRFRSAHRSSCTYQTYVQYDTTCIVGWYCTCPGGSRVVGCCSHVAASIWFLGFERHQPTTNRQPSATNTANIHYSENISDFEPSSDEDEGDSRYTL